MELCFASLSFTNVGPVCLANAIANGEPVYFAIANGGPVYFAIANGGPVYLAIASVSECLVIIKINTVLMI